MLLQVRPHNYSLPTPFYLNANMRTEIKTQYSIPAPNRDKRVRQECDDSTTTIYESTKRLPLLAFATLLATSPASERSGIEHAQVANPMACLFEAVSYMERATSLSFDNGSLEDYMHKSISTTILGNSRIIDDADDIIDFDAKYNTKPNKSHALEAQIVNVKRGQIILSDDWYEELEDAFYEV